MVPTKGDFTALIRLAMPVAAVQVGVMLMGAVDTVMVGHLSARDLAAVALGNLYFFLTASFGKGGSTTPAPQPFATFPVVGAWCPSRTWTPPSGI